MGWSLSWVAVQGKSPEEIHAALGLRPTGASCDVAEARLCGARLADGWYVVIADHDFRFIEDSAATSAIARLSSNAIACGVEEHAMVSHAKQWRDGAVQWSVSHDGSGGGRDLVTEGELPSDFERLRGEALAKYKHEPTGADFVFDVPLELAEGQTQFRHDSSDLQFAVLEMSDLGRDGPKVKPWWKFW